MQTNTDTNGRRDRYCSFGFFTFDLETEELFKRGKRVKLQPLPSRLLSLLLVQNGELISKEVIKGHLWPSSIVDYEQRIASILRDIRRVLSDDSQEPEFIETVPKKGYRFVGSLSFADHSNGNIQIRVKIGKSGLFLTTAIIALFIAILIFV